MITERAAPVSVVEAGGTRYLQLFEGTKKNGSKAVPAKDSNL
ncbi:MULTISPECIES: hypothetical protein [unclassified Micromonospora]